MKIWQKILVIFSLATLLVCSVCSVCFGAVGGYDVDYEQYLSPSLVEFDSHDLVVISNGTFGSVDNCEVDMIDYMVAVINEPNLTTFNLYSYGYEEFADTITLRYGPMYTDVANGPVLSSDIVLATDILPGSDFQADVYLSYSYYDETGTLSSGSVHNVYTATSGNTFVRVPIRDIVLQYGYGERCITDMVIVCEADEAMSGISVTTRLSGDYGITLGTRQLESARVERVNPNVLDWLSTSVGSLMNTPIFGEGLTLGSIMFVIMAVPLVLTFLKVFAGG